MNKEYSLKIIERVKEGKDTCWEMNNEKWDWGPGVFMAGVCEYNNTNGGLTDYIKAWVKQNGTDAMQMKTVNSTAPFLSVLELYKKTGDQEYLEFCKSWADWLIHSAPKTKDKGLEHTVTEDVEGFGEQMWSDTVFMAVLFIARLWQVEKNPEYEKFVIEQLYSHHKVLKDEKTGLFYHGWNCKNKNHMSGALWARANAWMLLSTVEILNILPDEFSERKFIEDSLKQQVKALAKCQTDDGAFRTVLNVNEAYKEASATAGISAGIKRGVKYGILQPDDLSIAEKAQEYVLKNINDKGEVENVSGGTPIMNTIEDYLTITLGCRLYGQGLTLFMLNC